MQTNCFHFFARLLIALTVVHALSSINVWADEKDSHSEKAMTAYADAANFQTNGALDLAIEAWTEFLRDYADNPMASNAAHYLGVCYMQQESPDYVAASDAFRKALNETKYDLREESLVNHGWCLYASSGEAPNRNPKPLREALKTFSSLEKEFPKTKFLDRSIFYSAESAYSLGDTKKAIQLYDRLLALPDVGDSPLRCDALYARGVAYEDLEQFDRAISSFRQLLSSCDREDLITDVHLRIGDTAILRKDVDKAIESFDAAMKSAESEEDIAYALFRQAFALVQAKRPNEAAAKYEQLLDQYPKSRYAATARLASAQSAYRGGEMKTAEKRFREVYSEGNVEAATEAAHWLARMRIADGTPADAIRIAKKRIDDGMEGPFAVSLRIDHAEATSMDPKTVKESIGLFEAIYRDHPKDPLAPRALYNAAFSAIQSNQGQQSLGLATEFLKKFPGDLLKSDVMYIAAESSLLTGDPKKAAETYGELLKEKSAQSNPQRPLWIMRAAATSNAARNFEQTVKLIKEELPSLREPLQVAEAQFLLGEAQLMARKPSDAATAFAASVNAAPKWQRASEANVLLGQSLLAAGKQDAAKKTWETLIKKEPKSRMADQARYKLGQMKSAAGDYLGAVKNYDEIIFGERDLPLIPYAMYGRGWSLMQAKKYEAAIATLDQVLADYGKHGVSSDALLARGIARRNQEQWKEAKSDLETFLARKPNGTNLGHALYELALIDQHEKNPDEAAELLNRLVKEVPNYPNMDKVLYELGWSLREAGQEDEAEKRFAELTRKFPKTELSAEAAFFVGQKKYAEEKWDEAAEQYAIAANLAKDDELSEKSFYRLGWSFFKGGKYEESSEAFLKQAKRHPDRKLIVDAHLMIGECYLKRGDFAAALKAYGVGRQVIRSRNEDAKSLSEQAERQVRGLVFLHGGQSAAQTKKWKDAIEWYDELVLRFPASVYLPQSNYEKGFAYQQMGDLNQAVKLYAEVANNYRNEVAARARFMMGEIYFGNRQFQQAIPEFQRVMFGYGAEKAPDEIKNWQAKSGFEAGRCSESLIQQAKTVAAKAKAKKFAVDFFQYVINKHPEHELAEKSRERLEAVSK